MFDVIRHIFIIPQQNQRNSKGEKPSSEVPVIEVLLSSKYCLIYQLDGVSIIAL